MLIEENDGGGEFKSYGKLTGVELARAGKWYPIGMPQGLDVTDEMIGRVISNYDPKKLTATVTFGHPYDPDGRLQSEGTIERLYWNDGADGRVMCADIDYVSKWTLSEIKDNRWVYPSIVVDKGWEQLYQVGFLGSATPGIEGLARLSEAQMQFSKARKDELQVVACRKSEEEHVDALDNKNTDEKGGMLAFGRKVIDGIAQAFGLKVKTGSDGELDLQPEGDTPETLAFRKRAEDAEAGRKKAEDELASLKRAQEEAERAARGKERYARAAADVEALVNEKFLTPAAKDAGIIEAFAFLAGAEEKLKFASADGKEDEKTAYELFLAAFRSQPPHTLDKVLAGNDGAADPSPKAEFAAKHAELVAAFKKEHERDPGPEDLKEIYIQTSQFFIGGK